jgi:Holliday junction resolvase
VNRSKAKGTAAETALLRWLGEQGHDAVRNPPAGAKDVGDLTVYIPCDYGDYGVTIEVKNRADIAGAIRDGLNELDVEKANAGTDHGVLVVKPRGKGDPGDWYAIRRVADDPEIGVP